MAFSSLLGHCLCFSGDKGMQGNTLLRRKQNTYEHVNWTRVPRMAVQLRQSRNMLLIFPDPNTLGQVLDSGLFLDPKEPPLSALPRFPLSKLQTNEVHCHTLYGSKLQKPGAPVIERIVLSGLESAQGPLGVQVWYLGLLSGPIEQVP